MRCLWSKERARTVQNEATKKGDQPRLPLPHLPANRRHAMMMARPYIDSMLHPVAEVVRSMSECVPN